MSSNMTPELPALQGLSSRTFSSPVDIISAQTFTLPELYEWNAIYNPQHPWFRYHDGSTIQSLVYSEAIRGIRTAAHLVMDAVNAAPEQVNTSKPPVIAILANSDSITYSTLLLGILRAGYSVFPISIRNHATAVAHLCARTDVHHIYVSSDANMQALAYEAVDLLKAQSEGSVYLHAMPLFEDLYTSGKGNETAENLPTTYDRDAIAFIIHSSGSTALPKPIIWTHAAAMHWTLMPWSGEVDWADTIVAMHSLPLFHAMGISHLCAAPSCGLIIAVFKPVHPPIAATESSTFDGIVKSQSDIIFCVPSLIEEYSRDSEKVAHMKTMKGLMYGGGPLADEVGEFLVSQGVKIYMIYGSSEAGVLNVHLPKPEDVGCDWNYMRFGKHHRPHFVPHGDGTFELIMKKSTFSQPRIINTSVEGVEAYATNDLFVEHPTKKGWWKIVGRVDDQIALSNGEKTNPGPLEGILCQDPHIQSAIVFGRGKFQIGALIDPKQEFSFDPQDTPKLEAFRNKIWPTVERLNLTAPQHSRLFKEMITVASPQKPFAYTAKGTPRRHVVTKLYHEEVEALYHAVEQSAQNNISAPVDWTSEEILQFVRKAVTSVLNKSISDEDDIFQRGGDSLQATWIRNTITRALRDAHPNAAKSISANLVYQAPTIQALTRHISVAVGVLEGSSSLSHTENMLRTVEKYTTSFPIRPPSLRSSKPAKDVVLLSGTTGGLGSDILSHLLHDESVALVYAYNRRSADVAERQKKAFRERGLNEADLLSGKFRPIEGEMSEPNLGLDSDLYEEIRNSVTHIIHNAWRVDFNLSLASFDKNIKATRRLVDLALTSPNPEPARLLFVSSVSVFQNRPPSKESAPEELIKDPSTAVGGGYGESKWVTETILNVAAEKTTLKPVTVRLGQVSGNLVGYWNEREWVPSIVKTALYQRCLPDAEGAVSWIPSYDAAVAIAQMRNSPYQTLHLIHPRPIPWTDMFRPLAEQLGVPLVPYTQWLEALRNSVQSTDDEIEMQRKNPALRLLSFFGHAKLSDEFEPVGIAKLSISKAVEVAPALDIPSLNGEHVRKWVEAWISSGFLPDVIRQ